MWELVRSNQRKVWVLLFVMALLLFSLGYFLGIYFTGDGATGFLVAFIVWVVLCLISYYGGDSILLGLSGARKIDAKAHPVLFNVVEEMAIASGLPKMPDVYVIDDPAPNAFATGRTPQASSLAVTSGLLEILDRDELQGVVAHEMAHIRNRDVLYMMMVGVMAGTIVLLADLARRWMFWGGSGRSRSRSSSRSSGGQAQLVFMLVGLVLMILAPILAQFLYFAVSRRKEYQADACGALYSRYPDGLARALEKISQKPILLRSASRATAPMYIVNPLKLTPTGLSDLSSTHPPISERVKILRAMGGGAGFRAYDKAFHTVTGRPVGVLPFAQLRRAESLPARTATAGPQSPLERMRQTTNMLWTMNSFHFIACSCGTTMKIPPVYAGKRIECPHCRTPHTVPLQV